MQTLKLRFPLFFVISWSALGGFVFSWFLLSSVFAQTYQIPWYTINSGGMPGNATSYKLNGSIAQSSIGTGQSTNYKGSFGFWYGLELAPQMPSNWVQDADIPAEPSTKKPKSGACMAAYNGKLYLLKASNTQDFAKFTPGTPGAWMTLGLDSERSKSRWRWQETEERCFDCHLCPDQRPLRAAW